MSKRSPLVRATERGQAPSFSFSHPLNPNSECHMQSLGDAVGLERLGLHIIRVPPGKDAFALHAHYGEEEFVLVLSGRGVAEHGDERIEVGPGDFLGYPTPQTPHNLTNPFDEDLVYLSGGERNAVDIIEFPRTGHRGVRSAMTWALHTRADAMPFGPLAPLDLPKDDA